MNPELHNAAALAAAALANAEQITGELARLHRQLVEWSIPTPDAELGELWAVVAGKRGCRR